MVSNVGEKKLKKALFYFTFNAALSDFKIFFGSWENARKLKKWKNSASDECKKNSGNIGYFEFHWPPLDEILGKLWMS